MEDKAGIDPDLRNLAEIDRLVHEPARLMILVVLYAVDSADFTFLSNATELTDGNLSSHLSKLEAAGYVEIEKGYAGKIPRTRLRLTAAGRRAVKDYHGKMGQILQSLEDETD
jgi:DNA-binding MarR family transcriptional regulator